MANNERNALAELADVLAWYDDASPAPDNIPTMQLHEAINKVQRIVAELAKVEVYKGFITGTMHIGSGLAERFMKCRAIAEEGTMNDNETVEQVCREISCSHEGMIGIELGCAADRIIAAHKREVAAKDAEIDWGRRECIRCREELHATRERRDDCEAKMRKALERVTRAEDALKAKDAEIASLRALVKELADLADDGLCHLDCGGCPPDTKCESKRRRGIIAKAREVVNE